MNEETTNTNENLDNPEFGGFGSDNETRQNGEETKGQEIVKISPEPEDKPLPVMPVYKTNTDGNTGKVNPTGNIIQNLSNKLSEKETTGAVGNQNEAKIQEKPSRMIDLNSMTTEELQILKQALSNTPVGMVKKSANHTYTLRKMFGKYVIDLLVPAFMGFVDDPVSLRKVETLFIKVKFYGENDYTVVKYSEFQKAERVKCEAVSTKTEKRPVVEGQTYHKDTGQLVEMVVENVATFLTLKLPEGDLVELEVKPSGAING